MKRIFVLALLLSLTQLSCVVGGYSSKGGWFIWPGGLGLLLMVAILFLIARWRR